VLPTPRMKSFRTLVLVLACTPCALAQQPTLSGRWSASAMQSSWNVGDWGAACGPRPGGGGAPAGTVTIAQQGSELTISGAGPTYSTTNCWEQFPGLVRSNHSGGARGWRTVCKTGAADPRQATVITTVSASDSYITFDETGQYQFVLQGQNCTASVRRSRSFRLIQREGEPPPAPAAPAPTAAAPTTPPPTAAPQPPTSPPRTPPPAPAAPDRCNDLGPPARLEVRPSRKLMRPGEEFTFRTTVVDAAGCPLPSANPVWRMVAPSAPVELISPGKVRVRAGAADAEVAISVSMAEQTVKVMVEIASETRYESLLRQRGFNEAGESAEAAVAVIASGSVGARSAVAQDQARGRRLVFAGIVGALAALCGVLGVLVVRRNRQRAADARERALANRIVSAPSPVAAPRPVGMLCLTCRKEYPPGSTFCAVDGNRLVALQDEAPVRGPTGGICPVCGQGYDPGIRLCPQHGEELIPAALYLARQQAQPAQPRPTKKICPLCGGQYEGDAEFCGSDGATLVPIN
jgi:hypothetical protein